MPLPPDMLAELARHGIRVVEDEPLAKKTWWRVGGTAEGYAELQDTATIQVVQRTASAHGVPVFVLGNASNLLISDRGIPGLVIRLTGELTESVELEDRSVRLGGGLKLTSLMRRMERAAWTGLEFFAGIPGTVGGAVRMNAGTKLGEVANGLIDAGLVLPDGGVRVSTRDELGFRYRHAELPPGAIVAWARFQLTQDDPVTSRERMEEHLAYRAGLQPIDQQTCGSTFRNPDGDTAGRLVEATGLKGLTFGRASVSEKHANFIVNLGGATASDIRRLIEAVQRKVEDAQGVQLEPEVQFAGDWQLWDPEATL